MKTKSLFILILCFLLPLELMAGTLASCDYLAKVTSANEISSMEHHCAETSQVQPEHLSSKTCHHCQVLCHHPLVFLSITAPVLPEPTASLTSPVSILVDSIILDLPQRPPQLTI